MLDGQKFLRELPVLHGKIEMPDYNGVCTGVYLICEKGMGFISIFCTNERKEKNVAGDADIYCSCSGYRCRITPAKACPVCRNVYQTVWNNFFEPA